MTNTQDAPVPGTAITTDIATHKLTIKLEDMAKFKTFYLTEKEAEWISKTINGPEQFVVLPRSVDPAAPSFYPKRGAWLERMAPGEREQQMQERAMRQAEQARAERDVQERQELSMKTNRWIQENPEQLEQVRTLVLDHRKTLRAQERLPRMSKHVEKSMEHYAVWGHIFNALKKGADPRAEAMALLNPERPVA